MTRQRRTHLAVLALVPLVLFTAVRCTDTTTTEPVTVQAAAPASAAGVAAALAKLHAQNDWVGQFHNDALGYVVKSLDRIPAKSRDRRNVCETARKAYREFHRTRRGSEVPKSADDAFEQFCAGGESRTVTPAFALGFLDNARRGDLSVAAQSYMDQFLGAIDASVSYDDLNARINSIDAAAAGNLSADEAAAVVTVGNIALSSADYWANNITAWDPYAGTNTGFFTRVAGSRVASSPLAFGGPSHSWASIWNDTKAAAKRAARGDVSAAAKALVTIGVAGGAAVPAAIDVVLAGAATGSIMAVLQF
jgi:hypothetical protein